MRKALLPALGVALAIIVLVNAVAGNRGAIARARADAARPLAQRDSLLGGVRARAPAGGARDRARHARCEASRLRDSVAALEGRRAAAQLTVRQLHSVGALQARLRAAFPELGDSA